jgi:hypothetical protein
VAENRKIDPASNKTIDVGANGRKKCQRMCVRSMGMENVVSESVNQYPDPKAG